MPSSFEIKMGLAIVGYPALAASVPLLAARFAQTGSAARHALMTLAAGAGLTTAHLAIEGKPAWPPIDTIGWIPMATAATTLLVMAALLALPRHGQRVAAIVVGLAAAVAVHLAGKRTFALHQDRFWVLGGLALCTAFAQAALAPRRTEQEGAALPWLGLLVAAAAAGGCAMWAPSAKLGMLLGALATTAGTLGIGGLVLRIKDAAGPALGVFVVHAAATLSYAYLYTKLSATATLLLAGAVLAPALASLVPTGALRSRRTRVALGLALTVGCAGAAAAIMHKRVANVDKSDPSNMYGG